MRRILLVLTVAAITASMMVFSAVPAFATDDKFELTTPTFSIERSDDKSEVTTPAVHLEVKDDKRESEGLLPSIGSFEEKEDKYESTLGECKFDEGCQVF